MTSARCFRLNGRASVPTAAGSFWLRVMASAITTLAVAVVIMDPAMTAAAPAAGESYVYRLTDGYTRQVRGQISYRIDAIDAYHMVVAVIPDTPSLGTARTDIYTNEGNWLRHPLINHDQPVDYEFESAFPAYQFPLEPGKSWSLRVVATNPATGRRNSVRVDGEVLGVEKIRVPAGEFDTIKIRRLVYASDGDGFLRETNIAETDWYAPTLGRAVRTESTSQFRDLTKARCCIWRAGDWNVYELVSMPAPVR